MEVEKLPLLRANGYAVSRDLNPKLVPVASCAPLGRETRKEKSARRPNCVAGAGGFEPPHGGIKIRCLTDLPCSGTGRCIRRRNSSLWRPRRLDHIARRDAPAFFRSVRAGGDVEELRYAVGLIVMAAIRKSDQLVPERAESARLPRRWRRGQRLEIDHKEIARRNTQALVTVKTDYHLATPLLATPGEALGESIGLIVVATGKRKQLSDQFFQQSGAPGNTDRSSGEQIGLGNQSSALVAYRS
jgi:hypothetical protein